MVWFRKIFSFMIVYALYFLQWACTACEIKNNEKYSVSLSCPYCVWLVGKEIELQLKWHCQGQATAEWPIDSWPVQWPFHVTGRKRLPRSVLGASDTPSERSERSERLDQFLSHLLPFARFQEIVIVHESVSGYKCILFSPIFKRHSPGFLLHFRSVTWPSSSSGQRIMSARRAVKPPADWASYNLWLISADKKCSIKVSVEWEGHTERQRQKGS